MKDVTNRKSQAVKEVLVENTQILEKTASKLTQQAEKANNSSDKSKSNHQLLPNKTENKTSTNVPQNVDWFALARKLRHDNRKIIQRLGEREQELALIKEELHTQINKAQGADTLINKQSEELNLAQKEISKLLKKLEESNKLINYKQKIIEQMSSALTQSQQQVAQLERQCSNLQDNCDQHRQKAFILEQELKEVDIRLKRQQRHNLQFKAALDQCLEAPGYVSPINLKNRQQTAPAIISNSRIPKNEGIKPWSEYIDNWEISPEEKLENIQKVENLETKIQTISPQLKILDNSEKIVVMEHKKSLSPLIKPENHGKHKNKVKNKIDLPNFPPLRLND